MRFALQCDAFAHACLLRDAKVHFKFVWLLLRLRHWTKCGKHTVPFLVFSTRSFYLLIWTRACLRLPVTTAICPTSTATFLAPFYLTMLWSKPFFSFIRLSYRTSTALPTSFTYFCTRHVAPAPRVNFPTCPTLPMLSCTTLNSLLGHL